MSHRRTLVLFKMSEINVHTLLFDGDCPFCRSTVESWRGVLERRGFKIMPLQSEWAKTRLGLSEKELLKEMCVITPAGRVLGGATALIHVWGKIWWAWPLWLVALVPGVKWLLDHAYRWVAERRMCLSGACSLHSQSPPKRGLGIIGWLPLLTVIAQFINTTNERTP